MKPFNLEEAKAGKPVVTRDGRNVRILCFDRDSERSIVALIGDGEIIISYLDNGLQINGTNTKYDLFMKSEVKTGWINVYNIYEVVKTSTVIYQTKEDALKNKDDKGCVDTVQITWGE